MTRKEILAMKPGRELDKAVALAVMGWREVEHRARPLHTRAVVDGTDEVLSHDDWDNKGPHPRLVSPEGNEVFLCSCGGPFLDGLPYYSTDIAAAWDVATSAGGLVVRHLDGLNRWTARFGSSVVMAEAVPEAICKARLLATLETLEDAPMG